VSILIWNLRKPKTLNDDEKIAFAETIAGMLGLQLMIVAEGNTIESETGGPKPKAIGYVYGFVNAVLHSRGWSMADMEIGPPITFHVIRRLWPGKESEYFDFLAEHLSVELAWHHPFCSQAINSKRPGYSIHCRFASPQRCRSTAQSGRR
jgi:hypothetical protein